MNLLERVLTLLRANLNTMVEKADDPEKVLRQLQLDMRNQLVQVKTQVATAIAEGHRLLKRSQEKSAEADSWLKKAEQAVQQGNDNAARTNLARYNDILKQAQRYQQQKKEQEQLVTTLRTALQQLEAKIAEVETTIDVLVIRKRNALIQQRVFDVLNKTGEGSEKGSTARARDAVMEAEARARAIAELHRRDLDSQLNAMAQEQEIEQQLNHLKTKQGSSQDPPLLSEGKAAQPSPLLHPQPSSGEPVRKQPQARNQRQTDDLQPGANIQKKRDIEYVRESIDMPQKNTSAQD
ncbi:MAG TPA: PspA/IM30 family protein [Ktedonosporobacter sp.]|nr:PspA/IM30 family protein [Ktedonosporobacter sp.]